MQLAKSHQHLSVLQTDFTEAFETIRTVVTDYKDAVSWSRPTQFYTYPQHSCLPRPQLKSFKSMFMCDHIQRVLSYQQAY